ncbi:unnamed protein product [Closterium sp. NIES-54]
MRMAGSEYSMASYISHIVKGLPHGYNLMKRMMMVPGTRESLDEYSITSYILQDEVMQEAEQPIELFPQVNYAAPTKLNQQQGQRRKPSGGGRSTEDVDEKRSTQEYARPRKEKQTSKKTLSTKDVDNASGKSRGNGEASCLMVGVAEPTVALAAEAGEDFQAMAAAVQAKPMAVLLDTGCSHHMMGMKAVFVDMAPSDGVKHVRGFNGALQPVEGRGTVVLQGEAGKRVLIPDMLYVSGIQANLLSAGQLKESGVQLQGNGDEMLLVAATGEVLGRARYNGPVLCTDLRPSCLGAQLLGAVDDAAGDDSVPAADREEARPHAGASVGLHGAVHGLGGARPGRQEGGHDGRGDLLRDAVAGGVESKVWAGVGADAGIPADGHLDGDGSVSRRQLVPFLAVEGSKQLVDDLVVDEEGEMSAGEESTDSDVMEVPIKKPELRRTSQARRPPERLSFHACLPPAAFTAVYDEEFQKLLVLVERQAKKSDRGGEFLGKEFTDFVDGKGIVHDLTCPYTPQQNGMAEREMRTTVESVRTMLLHMGVQHHWWHLALRQAVWVRNCLERSTTPPGTTPYQLLTGKKPDLKLEWVGGCMVQFMVPEQQRGGKLASKARWGHHLGVSPESKGWEVLDLTDNKFVTLVEVIFYETLSLEVGDDLLYDDAEEDDELPELDPDMHADPEHRWDIATMTVKKALASSKGKAVKAAMEEEIRSLVGMEENQVDKALYFKASDNGVTCWVLVYVDDLLAASSVKN